MMNGDIGAVINSEVVGTKHMIGKRSEMSEAAICMAIETMTRTLNLIL